MLKLVERTIASAHERLTVLAPPEASIPAAFKEVTADPSEHNNLLQELQRLRGRVYLNDGAIRQEELAADGRHRTPEDDKSWHVLMLDANRRVTGCIWYLQNQRIPRFDRLRVRHCALARDEKWGDKFRAAVESEILSAHRDGIHYAEVGGWAVAEDSQVADCLLLVLTVYALSQLTGGALVIATATVRHSSATILRRIGGAPVKGTDYVIPPYYDDKYGCEMELLRFDTRYPPTKYAPLVGRLVENLAATPVVANESVSEEIVSDPAAASFSRGAVHDRLRAVAAH